MSLFTLSPRRFNSLVFRLSKVFCVALALGLLFLVPLVSHAQETTGGLQGTVKDPSGAVVPGAHVVVTGAALVGNKEENTDGSGYYRFANLPPGNYTVTVTAKGFSTAKREGVTIEVGHLPSFNFNLAVGAESTVVEVTAAAPVIDLTTNHTLTNVTEDVLQNNPHGYSFQSVIQFAPMARNEPLAGGSSGVGAGGTGGFLPGSTGNGNSVGFSIGGAADSESSYLVEGQDTENISGGASQANVPFEFIQEVQVKTSGIEAEYGGALGGVINVVQKKGGNAYHGSVYTTYEANGLDGSPNNFLRYDPTPGVTPAGFDIAAQTYIQKKDHFRNIQAGGTIGGPIIKDRLWFFLGFLPDFTSIGRTVNFAPSSLPENAALGNQIFTQDNQQYFGTARLDASVTQKIRLHGSWLYQYARESGDSLPNRDSVNSLLNSTINSPLTQFSHGYGFSAPNATYNVGADITLSPKIVMTTRFGYFFTNYHDFGWPTSGVDVSYAVGGLGGCDNSPVAPTVACPTGGNPLPAGDLQVPSGASTAPFNQSFTDFNASKHIQFSQDVAVFKSGWWGTHNFKFGYQLNHLSNVISQHGNLPFASVTTGQGNGYSSSTGFGASNCALLAAEWGTCAGQFGYLTVTDFSTILQNSAGKPVPAIDWNHALYLQDAWTIGHGLTLNLGLRVEKETLPRPSGVGVEIRTINFGWGDKVEPRLGAAWGSRSGKIKIFGSYSVVNDVMKLLLAQTSFGAQAFEQCTYPLGPNAGGGFSNSDITLVYNNFRSCPTGASNVGANFVGGVVPTSLTDAGTGVQLIENTNFRPEEPIVPGLKPYRQHEYVAGVDYQISRNWAFEARYDRRRLDHVIEDASLVDPFAFEVFTIVNPGQGVNRTIDGYAAFLTSIGDAFGTGTVFNGAAFGTCPTCPPNPQAIRNYDGVELRVTKSLSKGWWGMFSYTWSRLWGNYTGLTTTEQTDGGVTGRNSPDTTRAFDEPIYYFGANGKSNDGVLPTDRPNTFKGNVYYQFHWKRMTTNIGLFQQAYQGSPVSSFVDVGLACCGEPIEATNIFGRGNFVNATTDPVTGAVTFGTPFARRTPWFTQTDLTVSHSFKVNKQNEREELSFNANFINLLNQRAVVAYWQGLGSIAFSSGLFQPGVTCGTPSLAGCIVAGAIVPGTSASAFNGTVEGGYDPQARANADGLILNSQYGQPNLWQTSRRIRLGVTFRF